MNLYEEISRVAYEIWLKKGMPVGCDMENWLEAEQIVYASLRQKEQGSEQSADSPANAVAQKTRERKKRGPYKKRKSKLEASSSEADAEKTKGTGKKRGRKKKTE